MFSEIAPQGLTLMASDLLSCPHGFTTRFGGVSRGIYASLNLSESLGDDPEAVRENYRRLKAALGVEKLCFTKQVHGNLVRTVTAGDAREPFDEVPACDGLVTDRHGLGLIIFTADCIPLLLYDPVRHIVGAAHAGWRGTVADIAGRTVEAMARLGADPGDIRAAVGPGISKCCFETGPEVPAAVRDALGDAGEAFIAPGRSVGKSFVDLKGVNRALLLRAGLTEAHIDVSPECTMCAPEKYWSHRATAGVRGSQGAIIRLPGLN